MKINITKKEYEKLLDILFIADWVMNAFSTEEKTTTQEYRDLEQKFFQYAKDFGADDLVSKEQRNGMFYPTRKFEDETPGMGFIEEFEEETFWDELIDRLTERDMVLKHGPEVMKSLFKNEEIFNELEELKDSYSKEFENNGLGNLRLR